MASSRLGRDRAGENGLASVSTVDGGGGLVGSARDEWVDDASSETLQMGAVADAEIVGHPSDVALRGGGGIDGGFERGPGYECEPFDQDGAGGGCQLGSLLVPWDRGGSVVVSDGQCGRAKRPSVGRGARRAGTLEELPGHASARGGRRPT